MQPAVKKVRSATVERLVALQPGQRHRHVRGPLTAVITYLLETGWTPTSAESWDRKPRPDGEIIEWNFPPEAFT
eukprot:2456765-Pyramimonas_sp.AAC.1